MITVRRFLRISPPAREYKTALSSREILIALVTLLNSISPIFDSALLPSRNNDENRRIYVITVAKIKVVLFVCVHMYTASKQIELESPG